MSEIKVTQKEIDRLMDGAEVHCMTEFGKCTVVTVKLANGFILTESSACVDPDNYNQALGKKLCMDRIENRLWELEGYALQRKVHELKEEAEMLTPPSLGSGSFGWAIECLKRGHRLRRRGWNGKSQYIELAENIRYDGNGFCNMHAVHEDIGSKAIAFCGTRGIQMGWLASQSDMLAEDWELAGCAPVDKCYLQPNEEKIAMLPVTRGELWHLINDTIAYIWRLEERGVSGQKFGYDSRIKLREKLEAFEREHFRQMDCSDMGEQGGSPGMPRHAGKRVCCSMMTDLPEGAGVIQDPENEGTVWLELPDNLRLKFVDGRYAGWYTPKLEEALG